MKERKSIVTIEKLIDYIKADCVSGFRGVESTRVRPIRFQTPFFAYLTNSVTRRCYSLPA